MSLRTTLILMWVFLLIGGAVSYDYFWLKAERENSQELEKHVLRLQDKLLVKITILGPKGVELICGMPNGCPPDGTADWKLVAPVQDTADSSSVGSLASAALNLTFLEKVEFEENPDPKEFGFSAEPRKLEIWVKGEKEPVVVEIGGSTAAGPNVYVANPKEPKRLYMVANYFAQMLDKDLFHWRNKRLFPGVETENISVLEWSAASKFRAVKKEGEWKIEKPQAVDGNSIMLEGLVSTLVYSAAKAVFADSVNAPEVKKASTAKPVMEFSFEEKEKTHRLKLYARPKVDEYLAVSSEGGAAFLVTSLPFARFNRPMLEFRDRKIFLKGDSGAVDEITFNFPRESKQISLKLENMQWQAVEKVAEPISQHRVQAILNRLFQSEATAFLPSSSQAAKLLNSQPVDVVVELKGPNLPSTKSKFLVVQRKSAITEGRTSDEVRAYGEDLLKVLPIRLQDLYESSNKLVIPTKEEEDGHNHSDEHSGHGH